MKLSKQFIIILAGLFALACAPIYANEPQTTSSRKVTRMVQQARTHSGTAGLMALLGIVSALYFKEVRERQKQGQPQLVNDVDDQDEIIMKDLEGVLLERAHQENDDLKDVLNKTKKENKTLQAEVTKLDNKNRFLTQSNEIVGKEHKAFRTFLSNLVKTGNSSISAELKKVGEEADTLLKSFSQDTTISQTGIFGSLGKLGKKLSQFWNSQNTPQGQTPNVSGNSSTGTL